jgi:hypothetical protein
MLRVTEVLANGNEFGAETFDVYTPAEVNEAMDRYADAFLMWETVDGVRTFPANAQTVTLACEFPQFERTSFGDYCSKCHWNKHLHGARWANWQPMPERDANGVLENTPAGMTLDEYLERN